MAEYTGVAALIIVGIILLAAFYLINGSHKVYPSQTANKSQNTTQPKQNSTGTQKPNSSKTSGTGSSPGYPNGKNQTSSGKPEYYCLQNRTSVLVYNGNFSTGTFENWNVTGSGFGPSPVNLYNANQNGYYYQNEWSGYYGMYAATTYHQLSLPTPGNISTSFVVILPYLNFQIYSPQSSNLYVEILFNGKPAIVSYYDTLNGQDTNRTDTFADASINMSSLMCDSVTLRVVSKVLSATSNYQNLFIAVGNFYQTLYPYETPGILLNSTVT